ncbi:MAG: hypothetical protein AAGE65_04325 [Planctomycetota bacterium]
MPNQADQIQIEHVPKPPNNADEQAKPDESDRLVPVTESIRYRKRAQLAETQSEALQRRVDELTRALADNEQTIAALERRQRIDAELAKADAVDFDVVRLLTEAAVSAMDEPDVAEAVDDLRRHKPYLFRLRGRAARNMGPTPQDLASPLEDAAERAIASGDRRDLLQYLRLRRGS